LDSEDGGLPSLKYVRNFPITAVTFALAYTSVLILDMAKHVGESTMLEELPTLVSTRQHPRYALRTGVILYRLGSAPAPGLTINISEAGLAAIFADNLPLNEPVELQVEVSRAPLILPATIRYRTGFRYGFELRAMNHEDFGRLTQLLKVLRKED